MKIVDITACIRVTKENDMYGMEYYIEPMSIKWTRKIRKNWIQLE